MPLHIAQQNKRIWYSNKQVNKDHASKANGNFQMPLLVADILRLKSTWLGICLPEEQTLERIPTTWSLNFFKSLCVHKIPFKCNILPRLSCIWNDVYEICTKYIIGRNIYVRSKFSCMRSSHDLCARARAHSFSGTLIPTTWSLLRCGRFW